VNAGFPYQQLRGINRTHGLFLSGVNQISMRCRRRIKKQRHLKAARSSRLQTSPVKFSLQIK